VALILAAMSQAALVEETDSFLTSKATTAKPRPALPALAAALLIVRLQL
jgi:hypothetical protein